MTTYVILQARGLEIDDRGATDERHPTGRPKFVQIDTVEAHGPAAATLLAAEKNPEIADVDFGLGFYAVPLRNWHSVALAPKRGFELAPPEGSLLYEGGQG